MKKRILSLSIALGMFSASALSIPITTQIITIMDESGSMSGEQAWIDDAMIDLDLQLLQLAGSDPYDAGFGLVGYGGGLGQPDPWDPRKILVGGNDYGNITEFATATNNLTAWGAVEDGYEAIDFVFDNYNVGFSLSTIFLVTDEDRDTRSSASYLSVLQQLEDTETLLNVVVPCTFYNTDGAIVFGIGSDNVAYSTNSNNETVLSVGDLTRTSCSGNTSKTDYVDLAFASGGSSWSIAALRNSPSAFTPSFIKDFTGGIINQGQKVANVPAPASVLFVALSGLFLFRRKLKS